MSPLPDPHSARLVATCGSLLNLLESCDELGLELTGAAEKQGKGILRMLGPAAVMCAVLQGSESARDAERTPELIDLFVHTAGERRDALLAELPAPQRRAVRRHAASRSVPPARVVELFGEAVSGMKRKDVLRRLAEGDGARRVAEQIDKLRRGELDAEGLQAAVDGLATGPTGDEGAERPLDALPEEPIPTAALTVLGDVLAGIGLGEDALARALSGALPPRAPEGYAADGEGTLRRELPKVGRNDPCPCGSGRKYKKCHGRSQEP